MIRLLLLFLIPITLFSIDINEETQKLELLARTSILVDTDNSLTIQDVIDKVFTPCRENTLAHGYAPHRSVWIKITLHNTSSDSITKILSYEHPITQSVTFYDNNTSITSGFWHRSENKRYFLPSFTISLQAHEIRTFYIKAHSEYTTLITKLTLWEPSILKERDTNISYLILVFLSIVITLLIYNLVLYFFTKEKAYIYYIFYLLAMLLAHSSRSGILSYFLLSDNITIILSQCIALVHALFIISIILFTREFLGISMYPKLDRFLKLYLYYIPITALLTCYHVVFDMRIMLTYIPLIFLLLYIASYSLYKGKKEAIFYLIGWGFLLLAILSTPLRSLGFFNITDYIAYPYTIAFIVEAFFFSFALAYKIKVLNTSNQDKQQRIIDLQQKEQEKLESLVAEKTKNITILYQEKELLFKELNHRVKNNLQMILSLVKLQISRSKTKETRDALTVTKNRIDSFTQLYENIHLQEEYKDIETETYFKNIIDKIIPDNNANITVYYDITHELNESQLLYTGLILNELATNTFKYAFNDSGTLSITLKKEAGMVTLNITDNGKGFQDTKDGSLGLTIVRTLVEKQLYGTMSIVIRDGTNIYIEWDDND